jgi:transposase
MGTMNAEMLVAFIDDFVKGITQKTVLVFDNASTHHADVFKNKIEEWKEKDLFIWFLPTYSPHLNKIETLWRKIKYEWLKPQDYLSWDTLNSALDNIFNNIGTQYTINFEQEKASKKNKKSA